MSYTIIPSSKFIKHPTYNGTFTVLPDARYEELEKAILNNSKIVAIKFVKNVTGLGLKDAKGLVESYENSKEGAQKLWKHLLKTVNVYVERDLTNEEMLMLVKDALESSSNFFFPTKLDMLKCLVENIEKHGGSKKIAAAIDDVIDDL